MPDVNVSFVHPTDGRIMTVTVDDTMTAEEAVGELLANNFMTPHSQGYLLSENGSLLRGGQTLADAGVRNGSKINVLPNTLAGALEGR